MTLRLWLVRHAQSTWNAEGRLQGKADPPLTDMGRRQAAQVAQRLAVAAPDAIYASPLRRAAETAQIIGEAVDRHVIEDRRLEEIGVGAASGKRWEEVTQCWPHLERISQRGDLSLHYFPGAESVDAFGHRVAACFTAIRAAHDHGDVVVVSHGGVFRAYLSQIMNVRGGYTPVLHFANTSVSQVVFVRPGWTDVRFINDVSHLRNGASDPFNA